MDKQTTNKLIKQYFADYLTWLIMITFFMILCIALVLFWKGATGFIWAILILFVLIYSSNSAFFKLYLKIRKDLSGNQIKKETVSVAKLAVDPMYNFKKSTGDAMGKTKYRLFDHQGNDYILACFSDKQKFTEFSPYPKFKAEIEYLASSNFVLSLRIVDDHLGPKDLQRQKDNIEQMKNLFHPYMQ